MYLTQIFPYIFSITLYSNFVYSFCSHLDHPSSVQLCVLPHDCLVSHWSNWTSFSQSVPTPRSRVTLTRQRNILQVPRGSGDVCPDLAQDREVDTAEVITNCNGFVYFSFIYYKLYFKPTGTDGYVEFGYLDNHDITIFLVHITTTAVTHPHTHIHTHPHAHTNKHTQTYSLSVKLVLVLKRPVSPDLTIFSTRVLILHRVHTR